MTRIYKWNGTRWAEVVPDVLEWRPIAMDYIRPHLPDGLAAVCREANTALDLRMTWEPPSMEQVLRCLGVPANMLGLSTRHDFDTHAAISVLVSENGPVPVGVTDSAQSSYEQWVQATDALLREVKDDDIG